jgi:hypothetical protein
MFGHQLRSFSFVNNAISQFLRRRYVPNKRRSLLIVSEALR